MSIEKTYRLKNETVFILSENYGGNGSPPNYFFVTIADNGKYAYSESFFPGDWTFKPHKVNNSTIRVELGFDENRKWKYARYKNGERLHRSDFKVPVKTMGYAEVICKKDHYLEYEDLIQPVRTLEMDGCPKCGDVGFGTLYYAR